MSFEPVPSQSDILAALRSFFLSVLPAGVEVVRGQDNEVGEPVGPDFVEMTPTLRKRLSTNYDDYIDCSFIGSISGTTLTASIVRNGCILVGRQILGPNVLPGTAITAQGTGSGRAGTYTVSQSQTIASSLLASGAGLLRQATEITIQCDVHGPASPDSAQAISTLFRDDYATLWFVRAGYVAAGIAPLHADDPKQIPFINAEGNYEDRWVIDVVLQANQIVTPPQDFADSVYINATSIDALSRKNEVG